MKKTQPPGLQALDLMEEAVFLLRRAPAQAWLWYLSGALPFVVGLLFFWGDMSCNPLARFHASAAALGMALLFVWMKCTQAQFAGHLRAQLVRQPAPSWSGPAWIRLWLRQAAWQGTGLLILPLALLVTLPFGWAFAFYQNLNVLESPGIEAKRERRRRALRLACLWPKQNHLLLAMLLLIGIVALLNIWTVMAWTPSLLKTLTGIETAFSRSPYSLFNSTFLLVCLLLAYVTIAPLVKAIYVLRCFHGESLHSGMDLRLLLPPRAALLWIATVLCLGVGASAARAQENSVPPETLDRALDEVLAQREYTWRMPRESVHEAVEETNWIRGFFDWIDEHIAKPLYRLWRKLFPAKESTPESKQRWGGMRTDVPIYVLAGILLSGIAYYALRAWHRSRVPCRDVAGSVTALASPDLNQEDVSAADLPWEGWLTLVEDLMRQGRYRLALRACFLAQLAQLADLGHIVLARYKTNRDYEGELARRHHVLPRHYDRFHHNRRLFEAVWYGNREVGPEHIVEFRAHMSTAAGGSA